VGGTPEVITPGVNGFFFEPGDIWSLGEIITCSITQRNLLDGPIQPPNPARFTLDYMVEEYFKLITH
jgi:glycosyltransferase involved in cell wall biosynthesis